MTDVRLSGRALPDDWYPGLVPANVLIPPTAYLGTTQAFIHFHSRLPVGLQLGRHAMLDHGAILDVGPNGRVVLGDYAIVTSARFICDHEILIGDHAMVAWGAVLMDSYRHLRNSPTRRPLPEGPIRLCRNAWVGFDSCILPGVTIGENTVVGARSVVTESLPPNVIAAGNPARILRPLPT